MTGLTFGFYRINLYIFTMEEIWKDIKDFEDLYQVSNMGRVKSLERVILRNNGNPQTIKERFVKLCKNKQGYYQVSLWKNGVEKRYLLHRLIAEHFIPNPENKPCIDHINTDPTDNRIENLRWCTHKENNNNPLTIKHRSKPRNWNIKGFNHWQSKPVAQLTKQGELLNIYPNAYSVGIFQINACCNGKRKTAGGYKWQYVDDYLADWWEQEMERIEF